MFGMSFFEILMIAIIAIIFLGPEKLPSAMMEIAKFFKQFKKGVTQVKETFNHELELNELRENALKYKNQIENSAGNIMKTTNMDEFLDVKNSISNSLDDLKGITEKDATDKSNDVSLEKPKKIGEALEKPKVNLKKGDS